MACIVNSCLIDCSGQLMVRYNSDGVCVILGGAPMFNSSM